MKTSLYLVAVPSLSVDDIHVALYSGPPASYLIAIGSDEPADRPLELLFGSDVTTGHSGKLILFAEDSVVSPDDPERYNSVLLTTQDLKERAFLLKEGLCIEPTTDLGPSVGNVRSGRCPVLLRLEFTDPFDRWTPLPHRSLAGAVMRNLTAAPIDEHLNQRFAEEAGKLVRLARGFLDRQRRAYEAALKDRH